MRTKTLFGLIVLCGSTAALANLPSGQDTPLQNNMTNEGVPAPDNGTPPDTTAPETQSNGTDVEPSADPTANGTDTETTPPNATY
ncbi:hypothetical protein [Sphingomonas turrisvirgatae]|uniref:Proteophosphoglycan ppg4 n=1 Tax=Sphingomonas turrisvirgatae TaxID=1888892 RepID=A0A1E3M3S7_9SPHN|nr:hypothetical protein [Sphingomonas turrisvirgatae]ODP39730.1 hypothetical protein BFL28_08880 [Sphingomonas turrisvirgatae]